MAGRDYDSFLAALRLHREQIEEAILVIERLVRSEKSSSKPPSWANVEADRDDENDRDHHHITYQEMLYILQKNRRHVQEAILAIERLAQGREGTTPSVAKRKKRSISKAEQAGSNKKQRSAK